jgi:hypothetical protein
MGAVFIAPFSPISSSSAAPSLVTCVNLQTGTERISHTGSCRYTQEAQANWRKNLTDSAFASGPSAKVITICSNKESSPVSYQVIRKKCARHQVTSIFSRSGSLPTKPVIAEAVSFDYNSASLKLATDPATNADAPIAFYTITSSTGDTRTPIVSQSQRVYYWKDLSIAINTLQALTRYTFTVSATTVDGTSPVSISSIPVTTPAYIPPTLSSSNASTLASPAFSLSSTAETKIVNNVITGYAITSTGGTIASYTISPAAPAGTTFNTSTGLITGTPTATQSAIAYTITATNASGSATATFTLTIQPLGAPAFTLSSIAETKTVNSGISGYSITSTGGEIVSYTITPTAPAGITFSTSTGLLSGTPTSTQGATTYTITATNASGSASATFTLRVAPSAPSFTVSSTSETRVATTLLVGYTIDASAGATVASYSLVGTLPAGLSFSTSNGRITGTPTETKTATTYTIIGTSASGETATATYRLRVTGDIGDTGPGGGIIFYYRAAGFSCGPTRTATCKYLEAAPSGWNGGSDPTNRWAQQQSSADYTQTTVASPDTATATGIGWGYRNTRAIVAQGNSNRSYSVSPIADSYTVTVSGVAYDDWYLPSKDELNQMCKWQRGVAWTSDATVCTGGTLNSGPGASGFVATWYWSSSEYTSNLAFAQVFGDGTQPSMYKYNYLSIRPIRSF